MSHMEQALENIVRKVESAGKTHVEGERVNSNI